MFTGLIQHLGRVASIGVHPAGRRLVIDTSGWDHHPADGDSISVSGVCLTVVASAGGRLSFDVVPETLERATTGTLSEGAGVNLEHAARADTLMGGHTVQGHVDAMGRVDRFEKEGEWARIGIALEPGSAEAIRAIVPKGSIAVEGVSLTVASVEPAGGRFEIALIPETLERTTLGGVKVGDRVNIETDIITRTIAYQLENYFSAHGSEQSETPRR